MSSDPVKEIISRHLTRAIECRQRNTPTKQWIVSFRNTVLTCNEPSIGEAEGLAALIFMKTRLVFEEVLEEINQLPIQVPLTQAQLEAIQKTDKIATICDMSQTAPRDFLQVTYPLDLAYQDRRDLLHHVAFLERIVRDQAADGLTEVYRRGRQALVNEIEQLTEDWWDLPNSKFDELYGTSKDDIDFEWVIKKLIRGEIRRSQPVQHNPSEEE